MKHQRKVILSIIVIIGSIILSLILNKVPKEIEVGNYPNVFSIDSVMQHVRQVSQRPHPIGSEEHKTVREYIINKIEAYNLVAEVQRTEIINTRSQELTPVKNVLSRLNGRSGNHTMMLVAHYDTQINTPGAGDDGAGVGILLEAMRYFTSRPALEHDIIFLFTDGEENRSVGAKGFVQEHPWNEEVDFLINLDTRGSDGIAYAYEMSSGNSEIVKALYNSVSHPFAASFMYEIYKLLPNYSDFTVFKEQSIPGVNIAFIDGFHTYHTMLDTPENLNPQSVNHMASYAIPLLEYFDSRTLENLMSTNRSFFNPVGSWFIHYPKWLDGLLFTVLVIGLGLLIFTMNKSQEVSLFQVVKMGLALIMTIVAICAITFLLNKLILSIHPWYDRMNIRGGTMHPKHFILLFSLINISLFGSVMSRIIRGLNNKEVGLGVLLIWGVLAIICQLTISGLSYLIFIPALPLLFSLAANHLLKSKKLDILILSISTLPGTFLLVPMVPSIAIALGVSQPIGSSIITLLLLSSYLIVLKVSRPSEIKAAVN